MTIKKSIADFRFVVIDFVEDLITNIATLFGYPEHKGMPIVEESTLSEMTFVSRLPTHNPYGWPPREKPENIWEMLFGTKPDIIPVERVIYESPKDGYYNFYIENFKNIYFLPDWLSEFIQIRLNICLDITNLELTREVLFLILVFYVQMLHIRLALYWYMTINPYTRPWIYFIAMTDWLQEALAGLSPVILGVDLMPSLVIGLTGKVADNLNHLVFTMPFLPSEGQRAKMMINGSLKDILVFRYLPVLWYNHPIPDDIREFWYSERREIYRFMEKHYNHLDIELLPNRILKESYERQHSLSENTHLINDISTQILCNIGSGIESFGNYFIHYQELLINFVRTHIDKLVF